MWLGLMEKGVSDYIWRQFMEIIFPIFFKGKH